MGEFLGLLPRVEKALSALRGIRVRRYVNFGCNDGSITEAVVRSLALRRFMAST